MSANSSTSLYICTLLVVVNVMASALFTCRDGGLDVSLFRYLSEHHPTVLVSLREQYRMNR